MTSFLFGHSFDYFAMPLRWQQTMTILSGATLQLIVRGAVASSEQKKW